MRPIIKTGWVRVLVFLVCLLILILLAGRTMNVFMATAGKVFTISLQQLLFGGLMLSSLLSYFAVLFFRRVIDKATVNSLGLTWNNYTSHAATGFFLGLTLLGTGTLLLVALGNLEWIDIVPDWKSLFINFVLMGMIAFSEELVFRGYILNNLMQSMNKWFALVLSAFLFAAFHSGNPGIHAVAVINLFLGGLLLGINYIYTKNLWFAVFFHFSWNFYQGSVLGYDVSGIELNSLLQHERTGHTLITGGGFGFEGSVISGTLCLLATILLLVIYQRRFGERATGIAGASPIGQTL